MGIVVAGETVEPLPERALWWPAAATVLVADVHLGKAETFRVHGVPVPGDLLGDDLARLDGVLARTQARRLVVLGDLIHGKHGVTPDVSRRVSAWRHTRPVSFTLVRGNHDRHLPDLPEGWGVEAVDGPLRDGPFAFVHHPAPVEGAYAWAGHVHPAAWVGGRADGMRLPCFHVGVRVGILPAFGSFTGGARVPRAPGDRVFAIAGERVIGV